MPIKKAKNLIKKAGKKIKYHLGGGKYGENMNKKALQTPEGRTLQKEIKEKGQWGVMKDAIKKKKWFTE
jgi:hypothetical protein